jgi:hypothetical protein
VSARFEPDYELLGRIVEVLRADAALNEMLFRLSAPVHAMDTRVYSAYVDLPEEPPIRSQLPRVLVEAAQIAKQYEQDVPEQPLGDVPVWLHTFAPVSNSQLAEELDARVRFVLTSTPLSTPRIIASGLVLVGQRRRTRETSFPAWRITRQYRAPLVGVL